MSLQDMLKILNKASCENMAAQDMAVLQRATVMLRKSGITDTCLQVGETVNDFFVMMADGEKHLLSELLQDGPLVLNFFRGFWCSYCKTELTAFLNNLQSIEKKGYQYLSLSPQNFCEQSLLKENLPPSAITAIKQHYGCDHDNQIAEAFGIAYQLDCAQQQLFKQWQTELPAVNDCESWQLPIPATYVINQQRQIVFSFVDVDFRHRFDPEDILEVIRSLKLKINAI